MLKFVDSLCWNVCAGVQFKISWAVYRLEGDTRRLTASKSVLVDQHTLWVTTTLPGSFCGDAVVIYMLGDLGPVSSFSESAMRAGKLPYPVWSPGKSQGMWDFGYAATPCPSATP
jgi:hypothetical protein